MGKGIKVGDILFLLFNGIMFKKYTQMQNFSGSSMLILLELSNIISEVIVQK